MSVAGYIKDLFVNPEKYAKFWVAVVAAFVSSLSTALPDSPWLPIVIQFLGAVGVFVTPNKGVK